MFKITCATGDSVMYFLCIAYIYRWADNNGIKTITDLDSKGFPIYMNSYYDKLKDTFVPFTGSPYLIALYAVSLVSPISHNMYEYNESCPIVQNGEQFSPSF